MSNNPFSFNEFISNYDQKIKEEETFENEEKVVEEVEEETSSNELNIQKAVIEEFAVEKAQMNEKISSQDTKLLVQDSIIKSHEATVATLETQVTLKEQEINTLKVQLQNLSKEVEKVKGDLAAALSKEQDLQERNPNALALLDRDVELPDRFPGETRDHVLEAIKEARDKAESDGRNRHAQILESVLVANEPNGNLEIKRAELEKLFNENSNIISGVVIEELKKRGISHKNGEEYLLPGEIMKRNF